MDDGLIDWLNDCLLDWLTGWLTNWVIDWLIDWMLFSVKWAIFQFDWLSVHVYKYVGKHLFRDGPWVYNIKLLLPFTITGFYGLLKKKFSLNDEPKIWFVVTNKNKKYQINCAQTQNISFNNNYLI